MTFDETDFAKRVPKKILDRTKENMEVFVGLDCVGFYKYASEIKKSYFYVV